VADAGRVIAGRARSIRLAAPGEGTRPLADRVKQTLFAILEPDLPGASVVDLFAGSGAAGIEALSRGAATAVFVERDAGAARVIAENLRRTGLAGPAARVERADVVAWLTRARMRADLAIVDPPYRATDLLARTLEALGSGRLLAPGAMVVAKHFWRDRPPDRIGMLAVERERRFGETALTFYRLVDELEEGR
jgi:16S rRNA (guanine966-N2)-methyltransferase